MGRYKLRRFFEIFSIKLRYALTQNVKEDERCGITFLEFRWIPLLSLRDGISAYAWNLQLDHWLCFRNIKLRLCSVGVPEFILNLRLDLDKHEDLKHQKIMVIPSNSEGHSEDVVIFPCSACGALNPESSVPGMRCWKCQSQIS